MGWNNSCHTKRMERSFETLKDIDTYRNNSERFVRLNSKKIEVGKVKAHHFYQNIVSSKFETPTSQKHLRNRIINDSTQFE